MRLRRLLAASVVLVSACAALTIATYLQDVLTSPDDPYDFGSALAIGGAYTHTFTVDESDPVVTNIYGVTTGACGQFTVTAGSGSACGAAFKSKTTVPTGCPHGYTFDATFSPTFAGLQTCDLDVLYMGSAGSDTYVIHVMGTAQGSAASLAVSPNSLNFGQQQVNMQSASQTITVTNTGTQGLTVTADIPNNVAFVQVNGPPALGVQHTLAPMTSETYDITCYPPSTTTYSSSFDVTTLEGPSGSTTLDCTGINSSLVVMPTPAAFGTTLVGAAPPDVTLTLSSGTLTMATAALDSVAMMNGVTVASSMGLGGFGSGIDAAITLHWPAPIPATGTLGTLTITTSTSQTRIVTITGIAQPGSIATNPASIDFGPVCTGGRTTQNLEVYASDVGDVQLTKAGATGSIFAVSPSGMMSKTLVGNHTGGATFMVTAAPTSSTPLGPASGSVDLTTNLPPSPSVSHVMLKATVLAGSNAPVPSPETIEFGTSPVLKPTSPKTINLANCTGADVTVTGAQITGTDASDFVIVAAFTGTLTNTGAQPYSVLMLPQSKGAKTAQLEIDYAGGSTIVPLTGTGGVAGASQDRETYYACGAGRPIGTLPLLLACAWLVRRRGRKLRA